MLCNNINDEAVVKWVFRILEKYWSLSGWHYANFAFGLCLVFDKPACPLMNQYYHYFSVDAVIEVSKE